MRLPILVPTVFATALFAAMVLAGPQSSNADSKVSIGLDRAAAYQIAIAG